MAQKFESILTFENVVKLCSLVILLVTQNYVMKSDIRELYTEKKYEIEHLQYQISELKDCCGGNHSNDKKISYNQAYAIQPHELKMEVDEQ